MGRSRCANWISERRGPACSSRGWSLAACVEPICSFAKGTLRCTSRRWCRVISATVQVRVVAFGAGVRGWSIGDPGGCRVARRACGVCAFAARDAGICAGLVYGVGYRWSTRRTSPCAPTSRSSSEGVRRSRRRAACSVEVSSVISRSRCRRRAWWQSLGFMASAHRRFSRSGGAPPRLSGVRGDPIGSGA
jgi:hypothetical protein